MTDFLSLVCDRNREVFEDALERDELSFDYHETVKVQDHLPMPTCVLPHPFQQRMDVRGFPRKILNLELNPVWYLSVLP